VIFSLQVFVASASAEIKAGFNYPGFQIGWLNPKGQYTLEIRGEYGSRKIWAAGPRLSYYLFPLSLEKKEIALFCALEGDYISFEGEVSKGTGYCGQIMLGLEKPIRQRITVEVSFGWGFLSLTDKKTDFTEKSMEPITQIGLNFYF
jgi:hypothetical protein